MTRSGMGRWLFVGLLAMAALAACAGSGGEASGPLAGRTFLSESVTDDGKPRTLVDGTRIRLVFHDDGRISASAGCNTMGARVDVEPARIVVGELSTTEMGCDPARHEQDEWLAGVLEARPAYTLEGDGLRLSAAGTVITLVDRKVADPDRPIERTVWKLDGIIAGETVSSVPGGVAATVVFGEGRVAVRIRDCNQGGADVRIGPSSIVVGPLIMTKVACTNPAASVESSIVAVLDGEIAYRIEAASLTLRHPGGKGLVLRAEN